MGRTELKVVLAVAAVIAMASCSAAPQTTANGQSLPTSEAPVGDAATSTAPKIGSVAVLTGQSGKVDKLPGGANAASIFPSGYIDVEGTAWMWGKAAGGRLGDGKPVDPSVKNYGYVDAHKPVRVLGLPPVASIAGFAADRYIAATRQGEVYVWGSLAEPMAGQQFTGTEYVSLSTPKKIEGLKDIVQVGAYNTTFFALDKSGNVWIWGDGMFGDLGDGKTSPADGAARYGRPVPQKLAGLPAVKKIAADGPLAISVTGDVYMWGRTSSSDNAPARTPTKLSGVSNAADVGFTPAGIGSLAVRVVTDDGRVLASGTKDLQLPVNSRGQEDVPTLTELPSPGRKAKSLSAKDEDGFLVIDEDGNLWGYRENTKYSTRINSGVALLLGSAGLPIATQPSPAPTDPAAVFVPVRIPAPANVLQVITPGRADQEGELLLGG